MKGTLCFWDRTGNSSDQEWVLVKKKVRCALVAENTPNCLRNTLLHKASGVVPGVGARARPSQEENGLELSKCAKIASAAATDGSTADTIELLEVHKSEFSEVARTGESVRLSLIHESSLARSCADVGAFGAGVSVSGSAAPCVAALPCDVLLRMHVERWRVLVIRVVRTRR